MNNQQPIINDLEAEVAKYKAFIEKGLVVQVIDAREVAPLKAIIDMHEKIGELALESAHVEAINTVAKWHALHMQDKAEVARLQHYYDIAEQARVQNENEVARLKAELERRDRFLGEPRWSEKPVAAPQPIPHDGTWMCLNEHRPAQIFKCTHPGQHYCEKCEVLQNPVLMVPTTAAPRSLVGEEQMLDEIEAEKAAPKGCPKCGGPNVIISRGHYHCCNCTNEWADEKPAAALHHGYRNEGERIENEEMDDPPLEPAAAPQPSSHHFSNEGKTSALSAPKKPTAAAPTILHHSSPSHMPGDDDDEQHHAVYTDDDGCHHGSPEDD